jgi:hypothetical protein
MAISRYTYSKLIRQRTGISSAATYKIYNAVSNGAIPFKSILLEQGQRLDHIAGVVYGDSSLWWVIAAASGIGWGLQPPPGTIIRIPNNAAQAIGVTA